MKMSDVRVGMVFRDPLSPQMGLLTVTALTPKGFTYDAERGYSLGARHGFVQATGHEHFGIDGETRWEFVRMGSAAPPSTPLGVLKSWAVTLREWAGTAAENTSVDVAAGHLRDLADEIDAVSVAPPPPPEAPNLTQRQEAQKVYRNVKADHHAVARYVVQECGRFITDTERIDYIAEFLLAASGAPEICICAAIRLTDGRIIRGHRHDDCIKTAIAHGVVTYVTQDSQGFMTSRNRFVGRAEGAELQNAAGIKSAHHGGEITGVLFSEDLYFDTHDQVAASGAPPQQDKQAEIDLAREAVEAFFPGYGALPLGAALRLIFALSNQPTAAAVPPAHGDLPRQTPTGEAPTLRDALNAFWCRECQHFVGVDEDGCCRTCGHDAEPRSRPRQNHLGAPPAPHQEHFCSGCHRRWTGDVGAELCGDCWRKGQAVILTASPAPPSETRLGSLSVAETQSLLGSDRPVSIGKIPTDPIGMRTTAAVVSERLVRHVEAALPLPSACDCGRPLTVCPSCAIEDCQAAIGQTLTPEQMGKLTARLGRPFSELREKMPPEAQARAAERTRAALKEIDGGAVVPLSEESIRATGDMLRAHVQATTPKPQLRVLTCKQCGCRINDGGLCSFTCPLDGTPRRERKPEEMEVQIFEFIGFEKAP